jgi:hypothetical protein
MVTLAKPQFFQRRLERGCPGAPKANADQLDGHVFYLRLYLPGNPAFNG